MWDIALMTIFINYPLYVSFFSSSQYGTGVLHVECIVLDVAHTIPILVNLYSQVYPLAKGVVPYAVRVDWYRCHNPEEKITLS
jgi:hypothetical protein